MAPFAPSMDRPSLVSLDQRHASTLAAFVPESAPEQKLSGWSKPDLDGIERALHAWARERADAPRTHFNVRDSALSSVEDRVLEDLAGLIALSRELPLAARDPDVLHRPLACLTVEASSLTKGDADAAARLADRVQSLPAHLEATRGAVRRAPIALIDAARATARHAPALLNALLTRTHESVGEVATGKLRSAIDDLRPALAAHDRFLDGLPVDESIPVAIGKDALDALLKARRVDLDSTEVKELARTYIEVARLEQARVRRRGFRSRSLEQASVLARTQTPFSLEEAAAWTQELVDQARAFLHETTAYPTRGQETLLVEEGSTAHGSVFGPVSYLRAAGAGPARLVLSDADDEIGLARFSVSDLEAHTARLAYPGHHLSCTIARRGDDPIRGGLLQDGALPSTSLYALDRVEGWAAFSESTMRELHFRDSPSVRLVTIQRLLTSSLLAWYDVALARGECSLDDAVAQLSAHAAMPLQVARRHIVRLARAPSSGLSALVGRVRLDQLRRAAHTSWRHAYSERRFNELVLLSGHVPVSLLFSLLEAFSPFNLDEGTQEYELGERPGEKKDTTSEG